MSNPRLCDESPLTDPGLGPALTSKLLLDFVNDNGNILLGLSGEYSTPSSIYSLLLEFDIALPSDKTSHTVDHFNYDTLSASEKHDVLLLPRPTFARSDVKNFFGGDGVVAFPRAVAQTLGVESPLLATILRAKSTAYSYNPKDEADSSEEPFATGEQISLVSALQARNSARFVVFGSAEALQDKWFGASVSGPDGKKTKTRNKDFARRVTEWTFMETGVLKVGKVEHYLNSDAESRNGSKPELANPTIYRVKNDVVSSSQGRVERI